MELLKPKISHQPRADIYDLTYSDGDIDWTLSSSPSWSIHSSEDERPQLRAVSDSSNVEIILDSGADVSALPRCYSDTGVQVEQHEAQFIDAQGPPLNVHSTRVAKMTFGDVVLKEPFIVTDVSIPILALGRLVRAGWSLQANGQGQQVFQGGIRTQFTLCSWKYQDDFRQQCSYES